MEESPPTPQPPQLGERARQILQERQNQPQPSAPTYSVAAAPISNQRQAADRVLAAILVIIGAFWILIGALLLTDPPGATVFEAILPGAAALIHAAICLVLARWLWLSARWAWWGALVLTLAWLIGLLYGSVMISIWVAFGLPVTGIMIRCLFNDKAPFE